MNLYSDFKKLDQTLVLLSSSNNYTDLHLAVAPLSYNDETKLLLDHVRYHVETAARELSLERFARFENELYTRIFSYMNGSTTLEKISGIILIKELLKCTSSSTESKVTKFAKALVTALNANNDFSIIELIADTLGHMARYSPVSDVDYLEVELNKALGWLQASGSRSMLISTHSSSSNAKGRPVSSLAHKSRQLSNSSYRRYAACKVLYQLATNAPTIFFARINEFFDLIWGPLWDTNIQIRTSAGEALQACLAVLKERTYHLQWYCFLYDQLQDGFLRGTEEDAHGSLIVLREALKYTGDFMIPRFKEVCRSIMLLKGHKSDVVRASIVSLLPCLAELCPDAFARAHMAETLEFLLKCSSSKTVVVGGGAMDISRLAIISVGKLCLVIGPYLVPRIDQLMEMLRECFAANTAAVFSGLPRSASSSSLSSSSSAMNLSNSKATHRQSKTHHHHGNDYALKTSSNQITQAALSCVSDMVQGLGSAFHDPVITLLEPMIQSGLTHELIATLTVISIHVPNQSAKVQIRLLQEVIRVLGGSDCNPIAVDPPDYVYSWAKQGVRLAKSKAVDKIQADQPTTLLLSLPSPAQHHAGSTYSRVNSSTSIHSISTSGVINNKTNNEEQHIKVKPSSSFLSSIFSSSTHRSIPAVVTNKAAASNTQATNYAGAILGSSIGSSLIGTGLGLGSEADKKVPSGSNSINGQSQLSLYSHLPVYPLVLLSLSTLASLSIPSERLIFLIRSCIMPYLSSDDHMVRRQAASTCAKLTASLMQSNSTKGPSAVAIEEVTARLLEVSVADNSAVVRLQLLRCFTADFDLYVSRSHHLKTLLLALADEQFDIKMEALRILGRLAHINPAAILPAIRQQLVMLLSRMKNSSDFRGIEEATLLLSNLLSNYRFHLVVRPFTSTLISTLPLQSTDAHTTAAALDAMGRLSLVLQQDMAPYADKILPIIISNMLTPGPAFSEKQEAAIRTLGQFISSTGIVIKPYLQYPQLLPGVMDMLRSSSSNYSQSLRMEILRTLGLLGALEVNKKAMIDSFLLNKDKDSLKKKKQQQLGRDGELKHHQHQQVTSDSTPTGAASNSYYDDPIAPLIVGENPPFFMDKANHNHHNINNTTDKLTGLQLDTSRQGVGGNMNSSSSSTNTSTHTTASSATTVFTEIIYTDELVADNADEPAHLGMYEQSVMRSIADPLYLQQAMTTHHHRAGGGGGDKDYQLQDKDRPVPSNDDYYPRVAINALVKILKDPSLSIHHSTATKTIISIFKGLKERCVPFLDQIIPYFLEIVRKSRPGLRESILQQLSELVTITGQHIAPFLQSIISILQDYWSQHLEYILSIVQRIAITAEDAFHSFLPQLLPLLLSSLTIPRDVTVSSMQQQQEDNNNNNNNNNQTNNNQTNNNQTNNNSSNNNNKRRIFKPLEQTLICHISLRMSLISSVHLFVPALCKLILQLQELSALDTASMQAKTILTLRRLCAVSVSVILEQCHIIVSEVVHTLCRTMVRLTPYIPQQISAKHEVFNECIFTLSILGHQLGPRILPFDGLILRSMDGVVSRGNTLSSYRDVSNLIRFGFWDGSSALSFEQEEISLGSSDIKLIGRPSSDMMRMRSFDNMDGLLADDYNQISSQRGGAGGGGAFHGGLVDDSSNHSGQQLFYELSNTLIPSSNAGVGGVGVVGSSVDNTPVKFYLNQSQLARSWDVSQRSTAADWHEWLWRFNIDLLRESPIPTMRACVTLAQTHAPMARELFNAAFVSCWHELTGNYPESLVKALQRACESTAIPAEILQSLLNLAEFMEHNVEALPIGLSTLADLAQKGHAYAKALHYRELEFQKFPNECFESLININKKLDQYDAASGLLKIVQQIQKKCPGSKQVYAVQESWLAKLGHWEEALIKYDSKLQINARDSAAIVGKMKCLDALGRWEEAIKLCEDNLDFMRIESEAPSSTTSTSSSSSSAGVNKTLTKAAVIGARAAWSLNKWDRMSLFVSQLPSDNIDGSFMNAVLAVHSDNYVESERYIKQTREKLDHNITALLAESYSRAYVPFIMVQQCAELEEIVEFKLLSNPSLAAAASSMSKMGSEMTSSGAGGVGMSMHVKQRSTSHLSDSGLSSSSGGICSADIAKRKSHLTEKWRMRIQGCISSGRAAISFWRHLLNVRRMVLTETEDLETWLDFVSLCRNGGNSELAERILSMSQSVISSSNSSSSSEGSVDKDKDPDGLSFKASNEDGIQLSSEQGLLMNLRIRFAILKQQWAKGDKNQALSGLEHLITRTADAKSTHNHHQKGVVSVFMNAYLNCLLKLGEWKIAVLEPGKPVDQPTRQEVLVLYDQATTVDPHCYIAWHHWGLSNYRAIEEQHLATTGIVESRRQQSMPHPRMPSKELGLLIPLVVNSVKGLMRALTLGTRRYSSSVTQDMLCILKLWFRYCKIPDVRTVLEAGLSTVPINTWLGVLPQLIARIDHPDASTRSLLHDLLIRLGKKHAQALVFPLFVAIKSTRAKRKEAAEGLMSTLREHSATIINQALLVSQELVRVAILWEENWHLSLEEASQVFYMDGNVQSMLDILLPLHKELTEERTTIREHAFMQNYGLELNHANNCLMNYISAVESKGESIPTSGAKEKHFPISNPEIMFIHKAWEWYYKVFRNINGQLPLITHFDLQTCSPSLHESHDLELGVPGTYTVSGHSVRIKSFNPIVSIIKSKQRPRKLKILGEDGRQFIFLLKGHEDLRQDERAMQLFGLVNALLSYDRRTSVGYNEDFSIQRYAVMPLSTTAGLISWVPNCDTLHDLIRSYRESRKVMLDVEHRLILQVAPEKMMYDQLPIMHKVEVFEYALDRTAGEDLSKILWLKSESSESWLQRRTTYTRSLAVMSMVGYILGLGDRHPSNLMLDRQTGKVIHIDFGDCFEVSMQREKYPEKVPFRLTRMLVNAMEVAGIEGNYRSTCEKVMSVLRENRDSLVATLEAFVHDPLVSWRLLNAKKDKNHNNRSSNRRGGAEHNVTTTAAPTVKYQLDDPSTDMYVVVDDPSTVDVTTGISAIGSSADSSIPNAPPTLGPIASNMKRVRSASKGLFTSGPPNNNSNSSNNKALDPILEAEPSDEVVHTSSAYTTTGAVQAEDKDNVATIVSADRTALLSSTPSQLTAVLTEAANSNAPTAHDEDGRLIAGTTVGPIPSSISKPPPIPVSVPSIDMSSSSLSRPSIHRLDSPRHGSLKTVSFAPVNQTLQADNRIINSSPRLEILAHPPPPHHHHDPPHPSHPSPSLLLLHSNNSNSNSNTKPSMTTFPTHVGGDESMMIQHLQIGEGGDGGGGDGGGQISHSRMEEEGTRNRMSADNGDDVAENTINSGNDKGVASMKEHSSSSALYISPFEATSSNPVVAASVVASAVFRENLHLEMSSLANSACFMQQRVGPSTGQGDDNGATASNDSFAYSLVQSRLSISMSRSSLHSVMTHTSKGSIINQSKIVDTNLDPFAQQGDDDVDDVDAAGDESGVDDLNDLQQELIEKAVVVIRRVMDKLTGLDFKEALQQHHHQQQQGSLIINSSNSSNASGSGVGVVDRSASSSSSMTVGQQALQVHEQVDLLIREASSNENLSQSFFGWCPFW